MYRSDFLVAPEGNVNVLQQSAVLSAVILSPFHLLIKRVRFSP